MSGLARWGEAYRQYEAQTVGLQASHAGFETWLIERLDESEAEKMVLYAAIYEAAGLGNAADTRCEVELQRIARKDAARKPVESHA